MAATGDSFMFTVGKLDAGMAILLGERAHLIEFPSLLLPPGATTGSIVNISVTQNHSEEKKRESEFWKLQEDILKTYGTRAPTPPKLEVRNVTQTSVTLEWPKIDLATAKLRSLDIYRNRQRLAAIPSPLTNTSTKLSGLQLDMDYTFQLIMRTTAGTYPSNIIRVRTHTMTDTSGISVCFGNVQDSVFLENAKMALREMGATWSDKIQIDTTHFVCTTPAATPAGVQATGSISSAPGVEYQKALQMSIPVVQPTWILACHTEKRMVPIHPYYLGATTSAPINSAPFTRPQSMSQANLPSPSSRTNTTSPTQSKAANRQSMPPPRSSAVSPPGSSFVNQTQLPSATVPIGAASAPVASQSRHKIEATVEEEEEGSGDEDDVDQAGRRRKGTMSKTFKFPPDANAQPPPPVPPIPTTKPDVPPPAPQHDLPATPRLPKTGHASSDTEEVTLQAAPPPAAPPKVEMPPPPPVDKEQPITSPNDIGYEDLGPTEEISLN